MSSRIIHTGVGQVSNTNGLGYSFSFATLERSDIQVEVIDPSNNSTTKTVTTHYTIENYSAAGSSNAHIKFVSETARGFTNSQTTYKVKISRLTPSTPKVNFTAGSSITASDLNTQGKQAFHLSEENRDSITSLAAGDATGAIQISGSNIADNSITTSKILDLEVGTADLANLAVTEGKIANNNVTANKLKSSSSTDNDRAVTTNHIRDGAVTNAKIASGISVSKVNFDQQPNFGPHALVTSGNISSTAGEISTTNGSITANKGTNNQVIIGHDGAIEITKSTGGAFIDFKNDTSEDHDARIQENNGGFNLTGNVSIGQTCTATTFSGSGASLTNLPSSALSGALPAISGAALTGLGNVKEIREATSTGSSSTSSSTYADKLTLSVSTSSNTRVIVFYSWEMKHSSTNNARVYAKFTGSNDSPVGGDREFSQNGTAMTRYEGHVLDIGSHSGTRTYKIQWRRQTSGNGLIQNAYLAAIAFNV